MNYRHAFHAGNFADLLKHAVVLDLMARLTAQPGPLSVVDTHAGAGVYDLLGPEARRSAEAEAGIGALLRAKDAPVVFAPLIRSVRALSPDGRLYPGSPALIAERLRPGDSYRGCEIRGDDFASLRTVLQAFPQARAVQGDGYGVAAAQVPPSPARAFVLIDPPFERPDDYANAAACCLAVLARNPAAVIAVWLPIKDLETLDAFQRRLDGFVAPAFLAEVRLRPLDDPMKMNGCALLVLNPPAGSREAANAASDWIVRALGEVGGRSVLS
jgi:23S rRNA (adenine2030-N6)-methyltransferase